MTVVCKMLNCGFNEKGFCTNPTLIIDENAMCGNVYKRGMVRPGWNQKVEKEFKGKFIVDDGDYRAVEPVYDD